jgi:hypothetical protein
MFFSMAKAGDLRDKEIRKKTSNMILILKNRLRSHQRTWKFRTTLRDFVYVGRDTEVLDSRVASFDLFSFRFIPLFVE